MKKLFCVKLVLYLLGDIYRVYVYLPMFQVQKASDEFAHYCKTTKVMENLYVLVTEAQ